MNDQRRTMNAESLKAAAGRAAAALVEDGMTLGYGTGSTTAAALEALAARVRDEGLRVTGVPTSYAAERLARRLGLPLTTLDETPRLDLALDGADEVDPALNLIKGRGAAMTRERIVAAEADRFVVLVDDSKRVARLGTKMPVPIEVVPQAAAPLLRRLAAMGAEAAVREGSGKDGPVVTDQGLWVIDARFTDGLEGPAHMAGAIKALPGVLDHGLFIGLATEVIVAAETGIAHLRR